MSAQDTDGWVVKFVPFSSAVESAFWVRYCREKLETIQLNEDPLDIRASYGVDGPPRLQCHEISLQGSATIPNERVSVPGTLLGFNTVETLQNTDKNQLLHDSFCPKFFAGDTTCLNSTVLILFADLKNHKVLYWFGIPALLTSPGKSIRALKQEMLHDVWTEDECKAFPSQIDAMRRSLSEESYNGLPPYFIRSSSACLPLSTEAYASFTADSTDINDLVFGFFDPTGSCTLQPEQAMGWPMRNLIAYLSFHLSLGGKVVKVLSFRPTRLRRIPTGETTQDEAVGQSILLTIFIPTKEDYDWESKGESESSEHKVVGWELNARSKPGPRWVNLRPLLDSHHLATQAADLNLKLMKWRMIPDLKVEQLQATKVLIIGAGTLGCNVARVLLGWGIRNFKIVDYGKVNYSNPARQSLFTLDDCHADNGSGRSKALAAAEALHSIAADVESEPIVLSIPMPGHTESRESVQESVETLDKLVQDSDAVFLLTDTRESRWLPTIMAAAHDKLLINAALGLDSWLVMRHGGGCSTAPVRYGCYFCNDVVAPENSTKNRTLDQQCTVTRPGLAPIASSMAVELMVSLLHHPDFLAAPAPKAGTNNFAPTVSAKDAASPLGVIPHQIRGSLVSYTMMTPTVPAFKHCTGCSAPVVEAYQKDKIELVLQTCQTVDGSYLEAISGLTGFRAEAAETFADFDDDDWDDENEA
jgi:ubiquitin-like modifier-activating enzyme ATG7